MRISQENVHRRGTKGNQSSSPQGTQAPFRLTFPKALRVRKRSHFKAISKERQRYYGNFLAIDYRLAQDPRVGITAPRSYGNAIKRNRFKRHVREAFRQLQHEMPPIEMVVFPKKGIEVIGFSLIKHDIETFYDTQCAAKTSR